MEALKLIGWYQGHYAGLSAYVDGKLQEISQALHEHEWRRNEQLYEWSAVNLATAEKLTEDLLRVVYVDGEAREFLIGLLSAISNMRSTNGNG